MNIILLHRLFIVPFSVSKHGCGSIEIDSCIYVKLGYIRRYIMIAYVFNVKLNQALEPSRENTKSLRAKAKPYFFSEKEYPVKFNFGCITVMFSH